MNSPTYVRLLRVALRRLHRRPPPRPQADLNAPDSQGLRPIHLAAMRGMSETVAALIDAGVPPDTMGAEGNTALHLASWHKEEGAVAVLMRAGEPLDCII